MATVKKIPERRCVGCGKGFPKKELIRVVRACKSGFHGQEGRKRSIYLPECGVLPEGS